MKLFILVALVVSASAATVHVCDNDSAYVANPYPCDCDDDCLTCTNGDECLTCADGFYLTDDKKCEDCTGDCKTCTSTTATDCSACMDGFKQAATAKTCHANPGPATCGAYDVDATGTVTCTACADGAYAATPDDFSTCASCTGNCKTCTSTTATDCSACLPSHPLQADTAKTCHAIPGSTWVGATGTLVLGWCKTGAVSATGAVTCTECNDAKGYAAQAEAPVASGALIETECKLNLCATGATCTVTPAVVGVSAQTEFCPATSGTGSTGTAGTDGPAGGTKAAGHTVQASLSVLLAGLALAMRQ